MTNLERGDAALLACNSYYRDGDAPRATIKYLECMMWYARVGGRLLGNAGLTGETFPGEWRQGPKTEKWREI